MQTAVQGRYRILLRHRDPSGRLYTVAVEARRVVSHDIETVAGTRQDKRLYHLPKVELAAFMDGDVLRLCRRDDMPRFLRTATGDPLANETGQELV